MDEYLFVALAKLKSDHLSLQRVGRDTATDFGQLRLELAEPVETPRPSARRPVRSSVLARWFSQQPLWREQS